MSEEHLVNLPAYPTSSSARSSLRAAPPALLPRHPRHSCSARPGWGWGAAAPIWRLDLPRSAQPGTFPLPKTVCAEISAWDGVGGGGGDGLLHCAQLILKARCIFICLPTSPPLPSFSPSLFFSLALYFFLCQPPLLLCENKHCTVANSYLHALAKTRGAARLDKTNGPFGAVSYL